MTFNELAAVNGVGVAWYLDVSVDNFVTVLYRYGSHPGFLDGGTVGYMPRIVDLGKLQRSLGVGSFEVSTVSVQLANEDGALDWISNRATVESTFLQAKWRLSVRLFQPGDVGNGASKVLGLFTGSSPVRTSSTISFELEAESFDEMLVAPTPREWEDSTGATAQNCPFLLSTGGEKLLRDLPVPLLFGGGGPIGSHFHEVRPANTRGSGTKRGIVVCATRDLNGVTAHDITQLNIKLNNDALPGVGSMDLPETFVASDGATYRIWEAKKSGAITKAGRDWRILYLELDTGVLATWLTGVTPQSITVSPYGTLSVSSSLPQGSWFDSAPDGPNGWDAQWESISHFFVKGYPLSDASDLTSANGVPYFTKGDLHPVDAIRDLIAYYSTNNTIGEIDETSFDEVRAALTFTACAKAVQQGTPVAFAESGIAYDRPVSQLYQGRLSELTGFLQETLRELCASFDVDLIVTWDGKAKLIHNSRNFATQSQTLTVLGERLVGEESIVERGPTSGERWAPYNRIWESDRDGNVDGPFDRPAKITEWGKILPRVLSGAWRVPTTASTGLQPGEPFDSVWGRRILEAKVRNVISFETSLVGLTLEVGDYFKMSWTRGGGAGPYSLAIWRCEAIDVHLQQSKTVIRAVWMDDLLTDQPYLLDDETLLLRAAGSFGRKATVTDSSRDVTFSSGDLTADGVTEGDHMVLIDSGEDAVLFTRNRALRIETVIDATSLRLFATNDIDFDAPSGLALSEWEIRRAQPTYPTSGGDYPSGSAMYGKVALSTGLFNDASAANKLLDG